MNKLPYWHLVNPLPSFHDVESGTVIEMTAKVYGAMNDLINEYNKFAEEVNKELDGIATKTVDEQREFISSVTKTNRTFFDCIRDYVKARTVELDAVDLTTADILQEFGDATDKVVSQDALTKQIMTRQSEDVSISLESIPGCFDGNCNDLGDTARVHAIQYVSPGEVYKLTTKIGKYGMPGYIFMDNADNVINTGLVGDGTQLTYTDYEIVAPPDAFKLIVQSTNSYLPPVLKKVVFFYTNKFDEILIEKKSANLFDKDSEKNLNGYILGQSNIVTTEGYTVSHPIEAKSGAYTFKTNATMYGRNALFVGRCDADGNMSGKSVAAVDNGDNTATIQIDAETFGAEYFHVNVYNADIDTFMIVEGDTMPSEYIAYFPEHKELNKDLLPQEIIFENEASELLVYASPLYEKKISLNGDSICYGAGSSGGYGKIIADKFKMTIQNIANSGGTIAGNTYYTDGTTPRHYISRTISNMDTDADYIILEGGVNDASVKPPLGTLSEGLAATLDDTTYYGAFESMLKQAIKRFPGKKIGYIAVHQMHPDYSAAGTADNYYFASKKCCEKWGVPFLDLNTTIPPFGLINPSNTELYPLREAYTYNADGWHPNADGYNKYYVPKIISWLESL